jgi:hypothetical protein
MTNKNELPTELQPLYESLNKEVTYLHAKWKVYRQVYAGGQEEIDILNRSASFFFQVVHWALLEDTVLGISRLTDPPRTSGNVNRCLSLLVSRVEELGLTDLGAGLAQDLEEIDGLVEPFRVWRNKRIAHSDLTTTLKLTDEPLPGISRASIEKTLAAVRRFMNRANLHFYNSETGYEHFQTSTGGDRLLQLLERADKSLKDERAAIMSEIERHAEGKEGA